MTEHAHLIRRYFELAPMADAEAYLDQFAPDAVVEDEGIERTGAQAIRTWCSEIPRVAYDVREVTSKDGIEAARVRISGEFPGSPVELRFDFRFAVDGRIDSLVIRP